MDNETNYSWLPEELRRDLLTPRGNRLAELLTGESPRYPKSIAASRYCLPLLADNQAAASIWKDVLDVGVCPLDVYWVCEKVIEQAGKLKTKKMTAVSLRKLESDIKKTATELRRLVQKTPVDDVLRLSGWRTDDYRELDIPLSDLLENIATSDFSDYQELEQYTRPLKKPGAKKAIRSEMILSLKQVLADVSHNRRNRLIADIVSVVIGGITSEETVKEILKNYK